MTCEVAVMNTWGIALAADSIVMIGDTGKAYYGAEKLFQLSPSAPVGIMTFGSAELMGVPWEIVIAEYTKTLGARRFDRLEQYVADLIEFIETARSLFPEDIQSERFLFHARGLWRTLYAKPLQGQTKSRRVKPAQDVNTRLLGLIEKDHREWQNYPALPGFDDDFADAVIAEHEGALGELEKELFGPADLPEPIRDVLRLTLRYFLLRGCFIGGDNSGVVIAGIGEAETFPSLLQYRVGTISHNRLKRLSQREIQITYKNTAVVAPFAQREWIDTIIDGIHPGLVDRMPEMLARSLPGQRGKQGPADGPADHFLEALKADTEEKHADPFMSAVAALPREDLAVMAEALVNLTAFRTRFSADKPETVGGPIDVAILSKSAGFVWVKRKRLVG